MFRKFFALLLIVLLVTPLIACGRKNQPDFPKGSTYPKTYPNPDR